MEVEIAISKLMEAFRVPEIDRFQYAEAASILREFRRPTLRAADGACTCPPDAIGHSYDCPAGGNPLYNQPRR